MLSDKTFEYLVINHEIIHSSLQNVTKMTLRKLSEKYSINVYVMTGNLLTIQ